MRDVSARESLSQYALADTAYRIFEKSRDNEVRQTCLETLNQINTSASRKKLQLIAQDSSVAPELRRLSASYLGTDKLKPSEDRYPEAAAGLRAAADD